MQLWELVETVTEEIWVWRRERTCQSPCLSLIAYKCHQGDLQKELCSNLHHQVVTHLIQD